MKQQHKFIVTKDIKCYKGTNALMQCANKFQYKLNKVFHFEKQHDIELCAFGFHGSFDLFYVQIFFSPSDDSRYFEAIIPKGSIVIFNPCDKHKFVASSIKLIRELTFNEAYKMLNRGINNNGFGNIGNNNGGNGNIGNNNCGNNNIGSGNSGNNNIGDGNSGIGNSGNYNTGIGNKGSSNSGNYNKGSFNIGNGNTPN